MADRGNASRARLRAVARRAAEAIVRPEDAELERRVNSTIGGAGTIDGSAIVGQLPPQLVQDESVVVDFPAYSPARNLEALLTTLIADIDAPITVREVDGDPTGAPIELVFPNGSLSWDPAFERMTVTFPVGGGSGGGTDYLYWIESGGTEPSWLVYNGAILRRSP